MKREVVQDFLNLPGIAGLALMDGRSRPYFCGVDRSLNFQQKEALAQGIQQVIDTTPPDFEFFEFHYSGHQVYIYKLDHGIILLVLTAGQLSTVTYSKLVEQLKEELQQDVNNAIATFRLLAGNATLSGQNYWKQGIGTIADAAITTGSANTRGQSSPNGVPPLSTTSVTSPSVSHPPTASTQPSAAQTATLAEVLAAMNHLSKFTTQYLGPTVVTNYWKATCPKHEWLHQFQVDRSAKIDCADLTVPLTVEHIQWIRDWVAAFINRCAKVIRDFPKTVKQSVLNEHQKLLLLTEQD